MLVVKSTYWKSIRTLQKERKKSTISFQNQPLFKLQKPGKS